MVKKKTSKRKKELQNVIDNQEIDYTKELCVLNDFINNYSSGASLVDISLNDLYTILKNPYGNIQKIHKTSRYMSNRYGIIKDVNEAFKYLPTLNFHLAWSSYDNPQKIKKYEKRVYDLIDTLQIIRTVRDGLGELAELGTVVIVNRKNKYIQFLDLTYLDISQQINGKWVVRVDLEQIKAKPDIVNSLPEEVQKQINKYTNKTGELRYVEIKNAEVLNIRSNRNYPYGFPLCFASWTAFLHKTLIETLEKSNVDKSIKTLLILVAKSIGDKSKEFMPPKGETVQRYFQDLVRLIQKKDSGISSGSTDNSGTGVVVLPEFLGLEEVPVNANFPTRELYEKLEKDIFSSIGVSNSLIYGGGVDSNYGSAQMNSEKFFRYIFGALEQWEVVINNIIKTVLPTDLNCRFYFDKTTITDREKDITAKKDFYMQTGIFIPYAEAVLGVPYTYALGLKEYQDKILGLEDIIKPPQNAFTQSGGGTTPTEKDNGRPKKNIEDKKNSSIKNDGNKGNAIPSPSD